MIESKKECILDKKELARYIKYKYKEIYNHEISPLKLQKSMYFLWGLYIVNQSISNEKETKNIKFYLFEPNFEAWKYGPVDPEIYHENKDGKLDLYLHTISEENLNFINPELEELFKLSNFRLMTISKQHDCYKEVYTKKGKIDEESIKNTFLSINNLTSN